MLPFFLNDPAQKFYEIRTDIIFISLIQSYYHILFLLLFLSIFFSVCSRVHLYTANQFTIFFQFLISWFIIFRIYKTYLFYKFIITEKPSLYFFNIIVKNFYCVY